MDVCFVPMLRLVDKTRFFRRAESLEDVVVGVGWSGNQSLGVKRPIGEDEKSPIEITKEI